MITVNGRNYNEHKVPVVGICMDGTSMNYYEAAASVMPNLQRFIKNGSAGLAHSVIPSFTNPNNMAIVMAGDLSCINRRFLPHMVRTSKTPPIVLEYSNARASARAIPGTDSNTSCTTVRDAVYHRARYRPP